MHFFLCDLFSFWRVIEKQFWHYFVLPSLVLWTFVWVLPTQKCDGPVLQHRKSDQRKPSPWAPRQSQGHNINNLDEEYKLGNCCQGRKQALTLQIPQKFLRTCFFVLISTVLLYDHVFGCAARDYFLCNGLCCMYYPLFLLQLFFKPHAYTCTDASFQKLLWHFKLADKPEQWGWEEDLWHHSISLKRLPTSADAAVESVLYQENLNSCVDASV